MSSQASTAAAGSVPHYDLYIDGGGPVAQAAGADGTATWSPDGKWIAYSSDLAGNRREIHVRPFPSGAGQWQISDAGGDWPRWRNDGKAL